MYIILSLLELTFMKGDKVEQTIQSGGKTTKGISGLLLLLKSIYWKPYPDYWVFTFPFNNNYMLFFLFQIQKEEKRITWCTEYLSKTER